MPIDEQASTSSTATGMSVNCNGVFSPNTDTIGPNGMTENAVNAVTVEITGARKNTALSARAGMMSSLNASFRPSARDWSRPNGPTRLGPGRTCMRATTRRSYQIANSVITTRNTNTNRTLASTSHQTSWPNWSRPSGIVGRTSAGEADADRRAGADAERAVHRGTGRVGRQPHDAVHHSGVDQGGQGDRTAVGGHLHVSAVGHADLAGRARAQPDPRGAGRAGQVLVTVLERAEVDELVPGRE